jgi:hypothetical protein
VQWTEEEILRVLRDVEAGDTVAGTASASKAFICGKNRLTWPKYYGTHRIHLARNSVAGYEDDALCESAIFV